MIKVNFRASEVCTLVDALEQFAGTYEGEDPDITLMIRKLNEVLDVDRWNPLSQLPPLGMKVLLRRANSGDLRFAVRNKLASSYSPKTLVMEIADEEVGLDTRDWYWTMDYD